MTRSGMGTRLMITMALLAPLVACAPVDRGLDDAGRRERIIEHRRPSNFLTCSQVSEEARVDSLVRPGPAVTLIARPRGAPNGGTGLTRLRLPPNAVSADRRFVLREDPGDSVSVTIDSPTTIGLLPPLDSSATLSIDVSRCTQQELNHPRGWWVWRMRPEVPDSSQKLESTINPQQARVVIDSTSKFMIAN